MKHTNLKKDAKDYCFHISKALLIAGAITPVFSGSGYNAADSIIFLCCSVFIGYIGFCISMSLDEEDERKS